MTNIDKAISDMMNQVSARKAKIAVQNKQINASWVTNCSFKGQNGTVNISTATLDQIVECASTLIAAQKFHDEACTILSISIPFKYGPYTFDEWIIDFNKRIAKIQINSEASELQAIEERLNLIVSPETRRSLEVEQLQKMLGNTQKV